MCVLAGFPSTPNKSATVTAFPFGIWFADAHTAYIADEDDGYTGGMDLYTHAAAQTTAGLQKWAETATSAPIRTDWSPLRIASRNTDSTVAAQERFHALRTAKFGEALRGVSFTPGTNLD